VTKASLNLSGPDRTASTAALTTAAGAVACGLCCALPFAFPAVAASAAGGVLAWLAHAHGWVTRLAAVIVSGAWISVALRSRGAKAKPANATLYWMAAASAALALAIVWPTIEPHIIQIVSRR
jgi:hypothetical protein